MQHFAALQLHNFSVSFTTILHQIKVIAAPQIPMSPPQEIQRPKSIRAYVIAPFTLKLCNISFIIFVGQGLSCYSCTNSGPHSNVTCTGIVKNCPSQETFCNTYAIQGSGSYEFTRDCVTPDVCEPDFCKKTEDMLGRTNCKIKCCTTDLCNRDVINTKSSASHGVVSMVILLGFLLLPLVNLH